MRTLAMLLVSLAALFALTGTRAAAQAVAGPEQARPVQGDPGISSGLVVEESAFRVLRDYAEPGATRRLHSHRTATYHLFVLITGSIRLTVEGERPIDIGPGEVVSLPGGANHTFINTGDVIATIVEVFGKESPGPGAG